MTENVLNKILESLSLDDTTAAETQLAEWFDSLTAPAAPTFTESEEVEEEAVDESTDEESLEETKEEDEEAEKVEEAINTDRRCGECGEVDAAMAEDAEFCDQCIEEANARMEESIDPLADLMEEFKGFTVSDKLQNKEGAQVGSAGTVPVNDESPVASGKEEAHPVEVKSDDHKGFDAEKAPAVKDVKIKNPAPEAEQGEVSDKLANQEGVQVGNAGKVSVNTVSPIGSKSQD